LRLALGLVLGGLGVLVSRGAFGEPPAPERPPARGESEPPNAEGERDKELPWGEAVEGWRIRVTLPSGAEYRRNMPLPLLLELQNVPEEALSLVPLAPYADPAVA